MPRKSQSKIKRTKKALKMHTVIRTRKILATGDNDSDGNKSSHMLEDSIQTETSSESVQSPKSLDVAETQVQDPIPTQDSVEHQTIEECPPTEPATSAAPNDCAVPTAEVSDVESRLECSEVPDSEKDEDPSTVEAPEFENADSDNEVPVKSGDSNCDYAQNEKDYVVSDDSKQSTCDNCQKIIASSQFRYVCVECCWNMCMSCEMLAAHDMHVVVRAPPHRQKKEVELMIHFVREQIELLRETGQMTSVKEEQPDSLDELDIDSLSPPQEFIPLVPKEEVTCDEEQSSSAADLQQVASSSQYATTFDQFTDESMDQSANKSHISKTNSPKGSTTQPLFTISAQNTMPILTITPNASQIIIESQGNPTLHLAEPSTTSPNATPQSATASQSLIQLLTAPRASHMNISPKPVVGQSARPCPVPSKSGNGRKRSQPQNPVRSKVSKPSEKLENKEKVHKPTQEPPDEMAIKMEFEEEQQDLASFSAD